MSHVHKRGPTAPEMNMTPLIDVTFQLIIFFMLVSNIMTQEAMEMVIPDLTEPRTRELTEADRVVVNVGPNPELITPEQRDGKLYFDRDTIPVIARVGAGGRDFVVGVDSLSDLRIDLEEARAKNPEVHVVLRADAGLAYEDIQPVMDAISAANIKTADVTALLPGKGAAAIATP